MNAERLLQHYERIADVPDAIARLRRFILDLAVRGKLVPQDPNDEPASELLKRIAKEKARLRLKGAQSSTSKFSELPIGWAATTIGNYATDVFTGPFGSMLHQSDYVNGGIPLVNPSHMKGDRIEHDPAVSVSISTAKRLGSYCLSAGDIVMARRGEVGRAALVEANQSGWLCGTGSFFLRMLDEVNRHFLLMVLRTSEMRAYLAGSAVGTTMVNLNHGILKNAPLLVPPLAEQRRIVAKVDELMGLCDRLEAARAGREAVRDRLAAASLARLNAPDTETFQADARFVLNALPALTTRPDQIKRLRQTILNLAVRGKLVPQDPKDEPASELLKRISRQRAATGKAVNARAKRQVLIAGNSNDVSLPLGWSVDAIGNLVDPMATISYGVLVPGPDVDGGVPFVRAQDLSLTWHAPRPNKTISPEIEAQYARTRLKGGEILLCVVGSIGKLGVAPPSWAGANIARAVARIAPVDAISSEYLLLAMRSDKVQDYFTEATRTLAQPTLNVGLVEVLPIPLPPLAEQHRIVAKVDKLMAICDRLEASLTATAATRRRLLDALLAEALAPADAREMEAAE
jgi:type I restriction enzyme S subunit